MYALFIVSFFSLLIIGFSCYFLVKSGAFYKPDIPSLQAEGEVLVKAIYQYEKIHGTLPKNKYEILADDKNIPFEARNTLLNLKWEYVKVSTPDTFFVFKYTGHMGDVLRYAVTKDKYGDQQYHWEIVNWK